MSAGPAGVGSVVIYHQATGVDVPATVWCTPDSWTSAWSSAFGNRSQPSSGQVWLYTFDGSTVLASEGTAVGDYSLVSLALDLGTVTATGVVVPDV